MLNVPGDVARHAIELRPQGLRQEDRWSLAALIDIARRRLPIIVAAVLLALGLAIAYLVATPPQFTATAGLVTDTKRTPPSPTETPPEGLIDMAVVESQVETLRSEKIALAVIDKLGLAKDPEFIGDGPGLLARTLTAIGLRPPAEDVSDEVRRRQAVGAFKRALKVTRVGRSYVTEIAFTSLDPEKAAAVANEIAEAYIADQLNAKIEAAQRAGGWMEQRAESLRQQAADAFRAVEDFKSRNNIIVDAAGKLASERELDELTTALARARAETSQARARLDRIEAVTKTNAGPARADNLPDPSVTDALNNQVIVRLRQQYLDAARQEADWSARAGPDHPATVNFRNEMQSLQRATWSEVQRIAETYRSDLEIARSREEASERRVTEVFQQAAASRQGLVKLRELETTAQTYRSIFETFLTRYTQTVQQQSFPVTEARVVTQATPPLSKSAPKTTVILLLALMGGGTLGVAGAFAREHLDHVVRGPQQLERELGLRSLGLLPRVGSRGRLWRQAGRRAMRLGPLARAGDEDMFLPEGGPLLLADHRPLSIATETLRGVKLAVDQSGRFGEGRVVGITSALPGEGKSTLAYNLAVVAAEAGRSVLLIDADLREAALTRSLAPDQVQGLAAVLRGEIDLGRAAIRQELGFDLLGEAAGQTPRHPAELLGSAAMKTLMAEARGRYDYVVVDLPSILTHVDVRAGASAIDAFVLVAEWGRTTVQDVDQALAGADLVAERLLGVVLNKAGRSLTAGHR